MEIYEQLKVQREQVRITMQEIRLSDEAGQFVVNWIGDLSGTTQADVEEKLIKAKTFGGQKNTNGLTQEDNLGYDTLFERVVRSSIIRTLKTELALRRTEQQQKKSR